MSRLKHFIDRIPGGRSIREAISYRRRSRKLARIGSVEDRFTHIYELNKWKDAESRSGAGSSLDATLTLRESLPGLIADLGADRLLDAPCGDYNWFRLVELPDTVSYIGGDIVRDLIASNEAAFGDDRVSFVHLDIAQDSLPASDLWLCRDCLIHLSYDDISGVLKNLEDSNVRYWLTTTHRRVDRNIDIPTGHCRMINLELAPFDFPPPEHYVADDDPENTGKCLGLWERRQLVGYADKLARRLKQGSRKT